MRKTILQLDSENKLKFEKRNKTFNSLLNKCFLRLEDSKIYIYYINNSGAHVNIINLSDYTISQVFYCHDSVSKDLEQYNCFELIIDRDTFWKNLMTFQHDVYKYAESLSNKKSNLINNNEKVFSSYPKLYKYDENKLIVNNETKNLTLEEYKNYIDNYNSLKIESWENENKEKFVNLDKLAIGFTYVKQSNNKINYFPRLFGKISVDKIHRKYAIDPNAIFYGGGLLTIYEKNKHGKIFDYSHLVILEIEEINYFKKLWNDFIHFIIKNTNKNKIDY